MVLCVAGNVTHQEVESLANTLFSKISKRRYRIKPPKIKESQKSFRSLFYEENREWLDIQLCFKGYSYSSPNRYVVDFLSDILGKRASRLWLRIQREGMVVDKIETREYIFTDAGSLNIWAMTREKKAKESIKAILREIEILKKEEVPQEELERKLL